MYIYICIDIWMHERYKNIGVSTRALKLTEEVTRGILYAVEGFRCTQRSPRMNGVWNEGALNFGEASLAKGTVLQTSSPRPQT